MHDLLPAFLTYLAQQFGGSTGWAIVSLSVGIRVALLPLTLRLSRRAMRGQKIVRMLQPQLEQMKKKFKKEPERLMQETMKLYREHGHRPFDGPAIIGMFAQWPIFALLYRAIGVVSTSGERFYWIRNLTSPDGWLAAIVLLLTAATAYFVPSLSEGGRSLIVAIQVGVTFFVIWKLAAGYGLYWASSNLVSLGQSLWLRREFNKQMA